jgi:formate-dependent nitrite reductase membrane component NrfD
MQHSEYVETVSTRMNPHLDPALHVWGWEVPLYLFMGGLVAGLLFLYSVVVLLRREERYPTVAKIVPLLATPLLGLGLFFLFLDLEFKWHVFRFYTSFQFYSPMSWGSWILLVVFGVGGVQFLYTLAEMESFRKTAIGKWGIWKFFRDIPGSFRRRLAWWTLVLGIALGIYTGLLLASLSARPMWNSALVGPMFLISGLSTGTAFTMLMARAKRERDILVRFDLLLVFLELAVILMWIGALAHGSAAGLEASRQLLGGPYSAVFWSLVVVAGLIVPAILEVQSLRGRWAHTAVAPALILLGGLVLRLVLVQAGQSFGYGA